MTEHVQIQQAPWAEQRTSLLAIRFRVFVDEQGVPPAMEEDEHDPAALHLLALNETGKAIACARLLIDGENGYIGRMAVLPEYRRQGIGTRLLGELLGRAREKQLKHVQLHAQCSAEPFYQKQDFLPVGPVFDEAGIPHRKMTLDLAGPTEP